MRIQALSVVFAVLGTVACGSSGGGDEPAVPGASSGSSSGGSGVDGSSSGGMPGDGTSSGSPASASLALSAPTGVTLGRGGPLTISVKLVRKGMVGAATVRVSGLPAGFTSDPVMVDATSSVAELTLRASDAAPTSSVGATIEATAGALSAKAPLTVSAPKGAFDTTFGSAGVVHVPFRAIDVLPLEDGSVIAFGTQSTLHGTPVIAHFDASGIVDTTLGPGGMHALPLVPTTEGGNAIALAAKGDGTFYALVSASSSDSTYGPAVAHVLANGALDNAFGVGGYARVSFDGFTSTYPSGLAVQSDGKLVISATGTIATNTYALLARVTTAGQRDTSFGTAGQVSTGWSNVYAKANGVRVFDGQIYLFGAAAAANKAYYGTVSRFDGAGNLDSGFGGGSILNLYMPVDDIGKTPAGKLLARVSSGYDGYLTQVAMNGDLDTTFGSSGYLLNTSPLPGAGYASGKVPFAIDTAGRIRVLIGSISYDRLEAWSFSAAGVRETAFGAQGSLRVETPGENPNPIVIRATPDGRLVALGNMPTANVPSVVFRFLP